MVWKNKTIKSQNSLMKNISYKYEQKDGVLFIKYADRVISVRKIEDKTEKSYVISFEPIRRDNFSSHIGFLYRDSRGKWEATRSKGGSRDGDTKDEAVARLVAMII